MWHRCLALFPLLALLLLAVPGEAQQAKGKKYALLVGVTEYSHASLQPLKFTENDVEEMAKLLKRPGSGFDSVRLLTTTRGTNKADDAPTGKNIKKALGELIANKTRHDLVLIALSGHGVTLEVEDPDGKGAPKSYVYFCPSDADLLGVSYNTGTSQTLLNLNGVFGSLGRSGAGTKLVLVDACRNELKAESSTRSIDPKQVTIPNGVGALFSCKAGQTAHEVKSLKHGVFFYHVLEGLKGKAKTEDNEVTWDSLGAYVRREVPRVVPGLVGGGAKQTPHAMTNIEGEPPVLLKVGKSIVVGPTPDKEKPKVVPDDEKPATKEVALSTSGGGRVFKALAKGIKALTDDDKELWSVNLHAERKVEGPPRAIGVADDQVFCFQGGELFCLKAMNGFIQWSRPLAVEAKATIKLSREGSILRVSDGVTVHRLRINDGRLDGKEKARSSTSGNPLETSGGGFTFRGVKGGGVEAYLKDELLWRSVPNVRHAKAKGEPRAVAYTNACVYLFQGRMLVCYRQNSGEEVWAREVPVEPELAVQMTTTADRVTIKERGSMYVFDARSGESK